MFKKLWVQIQALDMMVSFSHLVFVMVIVFSDAENAELVGYWWHESHPEPHFVFSLSRSQYCVLVSVSRTPLCVLISLSRTAFCIQVSLSRTQYCVLVSLSPLMYWTQSSVLNRGFVLPLARNFMICSVPWLTIFWGGYWTTSGSGPTRFWMAWQWPIVLGSFFSFGFFERLRVLRRFKLGNAASGKSLSRFQLSDKISRIR